MPVIAAIETILANDVFTSQFLETKRKAPVLNRGLSIFLADVLGSSE